MDLSYHIVLCEEDDFRFLGQARDEILEADYFARCKLFLVLHNPSIVLFLHLGLKLADVFVDVHFLQLLFNRFVVDRELSVKSQRLEL